MKTFGGSLITATVLLVLAIPRIVPARPWDTSVESSLYLGFLCRTPAGSGYLDIQFQALKMGTVQAPQALATPQIRLTNPAAEFIDHLDEDFHPALPNPAVQYDSKADDFRMKEDMKR